VRLRASAHARFANVRISNDIRRPFGSEYLMKDSVREETRR
jgi:hypothetical protein